MNTVLFGAFDRHNLGDLLLARIAGRETPGPVLFAGLAARDMARFGGPRVMPLDEAVAGVPVRLVHVGGELLDCDAAQAAYMLGAQETLKKAVSGRQRKAPGAQEARHIESIGEPPSTAQRSDAPAQQLVQRFPNSAVVTRRQCAYAVAKHELPAGSGVEFCAVGGVALAERPPAFRREVLATLREADAVSVRDTVTRDFLAGEGIPASLVPDPVTRIAKLFGDEIRARRPPMAGYLALQFAAEWGDDATLAKLARGIDRIGLPVVLFRAGAAPWHDDPEPYRRLAGRLAVPATLFESLHVLDICGLIAGAARVVATSLHVRIVADAFAVPVTSLEQAPGAAKKLSAYLRTWRPDAMPVALDAFAAGA